MVVPRTYTQYEFDNAVEAARTEAYTAAFEKSRAEGFAKGAKTQKERLCAILFGPEAKGREAAAQQLAFDNGGAVSEEAAIAILKTLPRAQQPSLAGDRSQLAAGGLVVDGDAEIDPQAAFEHGREIAARLRR